MTRRLLFLCGLLAVSAGCGGNGAVFLTIEGQGPFGDLRIPDDVDSLSVRVTDDDAARTWLEKKYPLEASVHRFPLTLGFEQGEATPSPVRITVVGIKSDTPVTTSTTLVPITRESVTSVTVRLTLND